jgi:hypothetical protein
VANLPSDPLTGTERLLIDGTNLLHALSRRPGAAPPAALIGRLRGAIPAPIAIELIFDGAPDRGMRGERMAAGLSIRYAGRRSADELLRSLVDEGRSVIGATGIATWLVVSDDHALRASLRERGARTAGSKWLLGRLDRRALASPSVGNRRAARHPGGDPSTGGAGGADAVDGGDADDAHVGWKPGRGATTKRGNPRRGRPSSGPVG